MSAATGGGTPLPKVAGARADATADAPPYCAIGDYALIGDCRSAALVSRAGSIDWLCWPRFDSPALFAALLDAANGGHFAIRPTAPFTVERCYLPDTNILQTTFRTAEGVVELTDLMPVTSEHGKRERFWPNHQILRIVECVAGEVEIEVHCAPRPQYATVVPRLRERGKLGFYFEDRGRALILRSEILLTLSDRRAEASTRCRLRRGDRRRLSLVYSEGEPAFIPPLGAEAEYRLEASRRWLAGLGRALPLPGPVPGRSGAQRARAQAHVPRAIGRRGGRAHDLAARAHRRRTQLGLPLLLAARRLAHAARARRPRLLGRGRGLRRVAAACNPHDLLYRYRDADGLPPGEGAFGICSFWAVDCRALLGDAAGAAATFECVLGHANDVGLYAEEIDAVNGGALGNFPQAFTHVGLIDAALVLERTAAGGQAPRMRDRRTG